MSIKPIYAERIFNGEKKFEYRKNIFKKKDIDTVVVYATKPVGKVIGEFKISRIIKDKPSLIWEETKLNSGICESDYFEYFKERENAIAIGIKNIKIYDRPLELGEINPEIKNPPQSFRYI